MMPGTIPRAVARSFARLPIKWKLTLWSGLLLCLLFAAYNTVQVIYIEQWMTSRHKEDAKRQMNEVLNYLLEREALLEQPELEQIHSFLFRTNESGQLIRILDEQGVPIVSVANGVQEQWIGPAPASAPELAFVRAADRSLLVMRSPITIFSFTGTVEIVKSREEFDLLAQALFRLMLAFGAGAVLFSAIGGWLLARKLLKPLQGMAQTFRNVRRNGLQERMPVSAVSDEISTLSEIFNGMMDEVERSFRQQSQFVEDASHELRTPIAIVEGHLALMRRWGKQKPEVLEESLDAAYEEMLRLKRLVQELLELTRAEQEQGKRESRLVRPDLEIERIVRGFALTQPASRFETDVDSLAETVLPVAAPHLEQMLLIVLDNAVKYADPAEPVRIVATAAGERVTIAVEDRGIGIPAEHVPHVTDRFYRVDRARSRRLGGNGIGLSIASRLAALYGGQIAIESEEGSGTTVKLSFPVQGKGSLMPGGSQ